MYIFTGQKCAKYYLLYKSMGCTSSFTYTQHSRTIVNTYSGRASFLPTRTRLLIRRENHSALTPSERDIVRETWPAIIRILQGSGFQIFLRIFETCPEAKALFSVENVRHSELARNVAIRAHSTRFINAISSAVDNLDDFDKGDNKFCRLLFVLGQKHKRFKGFKPEYFEFFYEALMWQWERCMGDAFIPEVADTWSHVFVYLMARLREGYFSTDETFETHI